MNDRFRESIIFWKYLYLLNILGTGSLLGANLYFSEQAGQECLELLESQRGLEYHSYSTFSCDDTASHHLATLTSGAATLGIVAFFFIAAFWMGSAFAALPTHLRKVGSREVGPFGAALGVLLPLYNLYAMFALPAALATAVETQPLGNRRPPRTLAIVAGVMTFVPPLWPIAAVLWVFVMSQFDAIFSELAKSAPAFAPTQALVHVVVRTRDGAEHVAQLLQRRDGHSEVVFANGFREWVPDVNVRQ